MKRSNSMLFAFLILFGNTPSFAQELKLTIADGSSSGTYKAMVGVIKNYCSAVIPITDIDTSGAVDNLGKLTENEANAGFMHEDVIAWRGKSDPSLRQSLKTLLVLWPEDVHFVAKTSPYVVSAGHLGFGKQERNLVGVNDLVGLKVGAAGGGYVTAQMVRYQGDVNYEVVQYDSGKQVLEALNNGDIAAAVFVGAAPLPNLKDLGHDYRILTIGENTRDKLAKVGYHTSTVAYNKMSTNAVTTVAANALLVAQQYHSQKWLGALAAFRQCFLNNLDEIKETPGMHKAWKKVDPNKTSEWPMYELPSSSPAVDAPPAAATPPATVQRRRKKSAE